MPRAGDWGRDEMQMPGTYVPAEVTSKWPIQNRLAMHKNGFVQFFLSEDERHLMVGDEGDEEAQAAAKATVQAHPIRAQVNANGRLDALAKAREAKRLKREAAALAGDTQATEGGDPPPGD